MTKKIAVFLPNLTGGGAEKISINLIRDMVVNSDLQIDLVLGKAEGIFLNDIPSGVNLVDFNSDRIYKTIFPLVKYLRSNEPFSLLVHISHTNVVALIAKRLSRTSTKVYVVEHNNLQAKEGTSFLKKVVLRPLMRWLYPSAERVIGVSVGVSESVKSQLRLAGSNVTTIYNPVVMPEVIQKSLLTADHPWFTDDSLPVFLGVGSLTEQKDFENLLEAFALMLKRFPARLIILGDGPLRGDLERKVVELNIEDLVSLPGFTDNPYSFMSKANCFVLSSRYEGLPTVLIEAMACGCNVISTDCPSGPNEILENGRLGKLVPIEDHHSLAKAMMETLVSPSSTKELKQRASTFTPENVVPKYVSLLTR